MDILTQDLINQTRLKVEEINAIRDVFANKDITAKQFREFIDHCNEAKLWLQRAKIRIENMRILARCNVGHFGGP